MHMLLWWPMRKLGAVQSASLSTCAYAPRKVNGRRTDSSYVRHVRASDQQREKSDDRLKHWRSYRFCCCRHHCYEPSGETVEGECTTTIQTHRRSTLPARPLSVCVLLPSSLRQPLAANAKTFHCGCTLPPPPGPQGAGWNPG